MASVRYQWCPGTDFSDCQDPVPCSVPRPKILFPILCSMTHCWEFAANRSGSIYIMEIGKCYKSSLLPYFHFCPGRACWGITRHLLLQLPPPPPLDSFGISYYFQCIHLKYYNSFKNKTIIPLSHIKKLSVILKILSNNHLFKFLWLNNNNKGIQVLGEKSHSSIGKGTTHNSV